MFHPKDGKQWYDKVGKGRKLGWLLLDLQGQSHIVTS